MAKTEARLTAGCGGEMNALDIEPFLLALFAPKAYSLLLHNELRPHPFAGSAGDLTSSTRNQTSQSESMIARISAPFSPV